MLRGGLSIAIRLNNNGLCSGFIYPKTEIDESVKNQIAFELGSERSAFLGLYSPAFHYKPCCAAGFSLQSGLITMAYARGLSTLKQKSINL
ncbi:hypothetical protein DHW03_01260 [Pedobacter yonginense]|uniref:Uncharacterized protein n=1 Tax=Pedobacter yonginense TaxID=651869 RepID=A0A317ETE5_9SPHI|nr:hypothetical protein DHW03_01260 [Pedobacter yonginense]